MSDQTRHRLVATPESVCYIATEGLFIKDESGVYYSDRTSRGHSR